MKSPNSAPAALLRGLLPIVLALLALSPAAAPSPEGAVKGRIERLAQGAIFLEGGARYPIKPARERRLSEALELITAGQGVALELDENAVVDIRATEPSFEVDATFDRLIESPGALFVRLRQGGPYQVPQDKIGQVRNQTLVIERGAYVRLTMFRKSVIAIRARVGAMPPARLPLPAKLKKSLADCKAKHIVSYNDKDQRFRVVSADPQSLVLLPVNDKGEPIGKRLWLPKGLIRAFVNYSSTPKTSGGGAVEEGGEDRIAKLGLMVGDTVGLGLRRGVIVELDPEAVQVRLWEDNRFTSTRRFERSEIADKIKRRELRSAYSVSAFNGELTILSYRQRIVRDRRIDFRARLSHDLKGYILAGAALVGTIDGDLDQPAVIDRVPLPPILAGEIHDYESQVEFVKPSIQLRAVVDPDINFISIKTKEARRFIAQRLLETKPERLLSAYDAVIANKDPDLIRVLATRALDESLGEQARADVVGVLRRCGEEAADTLVALATDDGDGLRLYTLDESGSVVKKPLRTSETIYRGLLVELIAKLGPSVRPQHALGLFDLYGRFGDSDFSARILETIRSHSDVAVTALIEVASEPGNATKEENARIDRANEVILSLGDAALDPLLKKLMRMGMVGKAKEIRTQRNLRKPRVLITDAIEAVVRKRRAIERKRVRNRVSEITDDLDTLAKSELKPEEIRERLDKHLKELTRKLGPKSADARKLIPQVHCALGIALRKLGERGAAAESLTSAVEAEGGGSFKKKARRNLAEIMIEAVREELDVAVLRSGPGHCYNKVRPLRAGEGLTLEEDIKIASTARWAPVKSAGKVAWVQISLTDYSQNAKSVTLKKEARPVKELREVISEARRYNAAAARRAIDAEIKLLTRETYDFARASRHRDVLKNLARLEEIAPGNTAREELYWKSWAAVYWIFIALGGSVILTVLVFGLKMLFGRKTQKIAAPEEYIYYGPDRARRERELE